MIRTGRGHYLSSIGLGTLLFLVFPSVAFLVAVVVFFVLVVITAILAGLLVAAPFALVLGACGFLHLSDDVDGGFVDAPDRSILD
jgi:hypothetical protein